MGKCQVDEMGNVTGLVGLSLDEAQEALAKEHLKLRIMKRDGEPLAGTCDYCPDRVNVEVRENIVVSAWVG